MPPPISTGPGPYRGFGYRHPNARKNWLIGGGIALVLVLATIIVVATSQSTVQNLFLSVNALPSSGSNTVAWYWVDNPFVTASGAQPLNVPVSTTFTTIASSEQDSFAYFVSLDSHGYAWQWGRPAGPNAMLRVDRQPERVEMPPGTRFTTLATNNGYVVALDGTGHLWAWGGYSTTTQGTLGTSSIGSRPVALSTPTGVTYTQISVGQNFVVALDSQGQAWAWGSDQYGDLGIPSVPLSVGTATPVLRPTPIAMPSGVRFTTVTAGSTQAAALDTTGRAWSWGDGLGGDLGVDDAAFATGPGACRDASGGLCSATPLPVTMPADVRFTALAAGIGYDAALDAGGHVWTWGSNLQGALGLVNTSTTCSATCTVPVGQSGPVSTFNSSPTMIAGPTNVRFVAIAVTQSHQGAEANTVALDSHGVAWAWGANTSLHQPSSSLSPCFDATGQPSPSAPGVELCVLKPTPLPLPSGVSFARIAATDSAVFGFPRS
jgi:alpha-tubulin suppressor-like RCC1 family protein